MTPSRCPECDEPLDPGDQTCRSCGAPLSLAPDDRASCGECGTGIEAHEETCPACGESGYPALRPRKGGGFEGAPDLEGEG